MPLSCWLLLFFPILRLVGSSSFALLLQRVISSMRLTVSFLCRSFRSSLSSNDFLLYWHWRIKPEHRHGSSRRHALRQGPNKRWWPCQSTIQLETVDVVRQISTGWAIQTDSILVHWARLHLLLSRSICSYLKKSHFSSVVVLNWVDYW